MTDRAKLIALAQIGAAQGLKGEVRVKSFCADPLALKDYRPLRAEDGRLFEIVSLRPLGPAGGMLAARFKGVDDRTAAEKLNGLALFVARDDLPPPDDGEEFYHADLIGLLVRDEEGREIGRVAGLHDFGGGDVLEVALGGGGASAMLPFTRAAVPEVSLSGGFVRVDRLAAGLLDDSPGQGGDPR